MKFYPKEFVEWLHGMTDKTFTDRMYQRWKLENKIADTQETCSCGVPISIHATVCGWENTSPTMQSGENFNVDADEKRRRWEHSQKPAGAPFFSPK